MDMNTIVKILNDLNPGEAVFFDNATLHDATQRFESFEAWQAFFDDVIGPEERILRMVKNHRQNIRWIHHHETDRVCFTRMPNDQVQAGPR